MSTTEVIGFDDVKLIKPSDINPLYKAIENLREQFEELEGTEAEEESSEAEEEIVVLETQKKKENSGIEDEDFDEYIAGLEDYGEGGTFVPIPLKLDDFKPFTESGNCLSDDVTIIDEPDPF